jgi:hypothetical protein
VVEATGDARIAFVDQVVQADDWLFDMDLDSMWRKVAQGIRTVVK